MILPPSYPYWLKFIAASAMLLTIYGCGGTTTNRVAVSGAVTYEGEAIKDGTILFSPTKDGQLQANGVITDGSYNIDAAFGPSLGDYKVVIEAFRAPKEPQDLGPLHANEENAGNDEQFVPAEFNSQSKLRVSISPDNATALNFDLPN